MPPTLPYFVRAADRPTAGASYFWDLWPRHYDYVYILFMKPDMQNPDQKHLDLAYSGAEFRLYRVRTVIGSQ